MDAIAQSEFFECANQARHTRNSTEEEEEKKSIATNITLANVSFRNAYTNTAIFLHIYISSNLLISDQTTQ